MATWAAPTNKQQTQIDAGPISAKTLTLGTPAVHSVLICLVAWAGAQTVSVSGGTGNTWVSKIQIDNGSNHCQIWYCLDGHNVATTLTANFTGSVTNVQLFDAEYPVTGPLTQGMVVLVDTDIHTATGTSTTPSSAALATNYENELWIGYFDCGAALTSVTAGTGYTMRTTAAGSPNQARAGFEDAFNTTAFAAVAGFTIASNPWEAGAIAFQVQSIGTTAGVPTVAATAAQGPLLAATATRFSINTDPMGASSSGGGINKVGQIYPTGRN
ncbi:MAG: hypothetical protein LAN64_01775 [Acidobacteriia bacterium]|nr:hypothetical protein [Terriglobia bacterium]